MNLIFEDSLNRHRCESEVVVNGYKVQCTFSGTQTVTIPKGLHYFDGNLNFSASMLSTTITLCPNHEGRLRISFRNLIDKA